MTETPAYDALTGAIPAVGGIYNEQDGLVICFPDAYVINFTPKTNKDGRLYAWLKFASFGSVFNVYCGGDDVLRLQADGVTQGITKEFALKLTTRQNGDLRLSF